MKEFVVSHTVFLHSLADLWWDKSNQIVPFEKQNFLFLILHCYLALPATARSKWETTNSLFNKDIFQDETISCGLWFKFTICVRHRVCVWVVCLWRIGMQRKSQRTLGHHETDTEVWNERDRAGVNVCMCLCRRIGRGCPSAITLIMLCRLILLSGGNWGKWGVFVHVCVCVCVWGNERALYHLCCVLDSNMIISWKAYTNEWYIRRREVRKCVL